MPGRLQGTPQTMTWSPRRWAPTPARVDPAHGRHASAPKTGALVGPDVCVLPLYVVMVMPASPSITITCHYPFSRTPADICGHIKRAVPPSANPFRSRVGGCCKWMREAGFRTTEVLDLGDGVGVVVGAT